MAKGTTIPGYENRNRQQVIRDTGMQGTDHNQRIYHLRCLICGHEYGANGSDIFARRCPGHDAGAAGLPIADQTASVPRPLTRVPTIDRKDYIAGLERRLGELEQSIAIFEDGKMHLFQGPSASQLTDITAAYIVDLKRTKADYEMLLSKAKV
jgi:hypothetical protein